MFIGNDFVHSNVLSFALSTDDMKPFWFGFSDCKKYRRGKSEKCGNNVALVFWLWATRAPPISGSSP